MTLNDRKCIIIKPDRSTKTVIFESIYNEVRNSQHMCLDGLDYLNKRYRLGMYCCNNSSELNTIATTILKYMRSRFNVVSNDDKFRIRGDVILYDDEKDMNKETWDLIKREVDCKKRDRHHNLILIII